MVVSRSKTDEVICDRFASVVLEFMVALGSRLRRQIVRPTRKWTIKDGETRTRERLSSIAVLNLVLEFQILEPDAMGEAVRIEVIPNDMRSGIVFVAVDLIARREIGRIGEVGE